MKCSENVKCGNNPQEQPEKRPRNGGTFSHMATRNRLHAGAVIHDTRFTFRRYVDERLSAVLPDVLVVASRVVPGARENGGQADAVHERVHRRDKTVARAGENPKTTNFVPTGRRTWFCSSSIWQALRCTSGRCPRLVLGRSTTSRRRLSRSFGA